MYFQIAQVLCNQVGEKYRWLQQRAYIYFSRCCTNSHAVQNIGLATTVLHQTLLMYGYAGSNLRTVYRWIGDDHYGAEAALCSGQTEDLAL